MKSIKSALAILSIFISFTSSAQVADTIYKPNIHSVRFHMYGDQQAMAIYNLGGNDQMELHFDDMEGNYKSYYYTYQLCDYDWTPNAILNPFDYIKGFTQMRITNYRYSSISYTKYTHYQVVLPESNSLPTRSGNYLLKVFLDGDMNKVVFTKRLLVLDQKATVAGKVIQPFTPQLFNTHQKLVFTADVKGLDAFSAGQQVKAVILQNNRWDNAERDIAPTFIRGNALEYNTENSSIFPAGKEWRWLDLRSFSLLSDRVKSGEYKKSTATIFVVPDGDRSGQKYLYYRDLNGMYQVESYETVNPYWQADYANVYFSLVPPNNQPYANRNIYLFGQLTDYKLNDSTKMNFNADKGIYEGHALLKQGYYNYEYYVTDLKGQPQPNALEGNYWETENSYTILIYYKGFTDRSDLLIGVAKINSRLDRPGFSF